MQFLPSIEYGIFEDYDTVNAALTVSRAFGFVVPFVEVGWVDNNFDVQRYTFANRELKNEVVATAGVSIDF